MPLIRHHAVETWVILTCTDHFLRYLLFVVERESRVAGESVAWLAI